MPNSAMNRQTSMQPAPTLPQVNPAETIGGPSDVMLGWIAVSLPLALCCAAFTSRKYRAFALQRRIRKLEKIWQIN